MNKSPIIFPTLLILAILNVAVNASDSSVSSKGIAVEIVPAQTKTLHALVYAQGTIRAVRREFLSFESDGKVSYLHKLDGRDLAAGDRVTGPAGDNDTGQLLASLDSRDSLAQLEIARSALDQANQQKIASQTERDRLLADLDLVTADLKRKQSLIKKQAIARSDFEKTQASVKQAKSALKAAEAGIRTAESAVQAAKAQVAQAQLAMERTSIFAPIDGIVSFVNIKEGQLFSRQQINTSSESAALKSVPIVIIDPSEYEIILDIPSFQGTAVKPGQKAFIFTGEQLSQAELSGVDDLNAAKGTLQGRVFSVSPAINPGGRSIQVKVRVKPDGQQAIFDGMFVNTWLVVKEKQDAVALPYNTLLYDGSQVSVFVYNEQNDTVERREITQGIRGLSDVEIVEGLSAGEKVVGKGRNRLTNGSSVEVVVTRGEK